MKSLRSVLRSRRASVLRFVKSAWAFDFFVRDGMIMAKTFMPAAMPRYMAITRNTGMNLTASMPFLGWSNIDQKEEQSRGILYI